MSILIKGISMPKNCADCIFCVNNWCVINSRLHHIKGAEETTQYCPLIEVPPHGRLIDANALKADIEAHADTYTNCDHLDFVATGLLCAIWDVVNAPTIIEAEEEET